MGMFAHRIDADLELRMLEEQDADELFAVVEANRAHLREWLPWLDSTTEVQHSRQFIRSILQQHANKEGFACAIFYKGHLVGVSAYHPIRKANRSVELGYWLSQDVVGKGIMTRCCRVLVDYAFQELDLNRVVIKVATGNVRSRAIPGRLGFQQEGVVRDAQWLYDHFVDHALYAMLKRDWNGGLAAAGRGNRKISGPEHSPS